MRNPRIMFLGGGLLLIAAIALWNWVSGWGLVTLKYENAPLSKVIKSLEWQGGIKVVTNADLKKPVTIYVEDVSAYDALETLAARVDGDARLAFVAAPDAGQVSKVVSAFMVGTDPGGWKVFSAGWGGGGGMGAFDTPVDPRKIEWKVSEGADKNLQTLLDQGAQKTGALFAVPQSWNPALAKLPAGGRVGDVAARAVKGAGGKYKEMFLLTVRPPQPPRDNNNNNDGQTAGNDGPRWEFTRTVFSPQRGGGGPGRGGSQEWMAERVQAQIAQLPPAEQAEAKKQFDEMRAFWQSVRELPEDQRRAKMEEMMSNPAVQDRMEQRREAQDSRRSPEQREDRMRRYLDRKQQAKQSSKS